MLVKDLAAKYGYGQSTICYWVHKKLLPARYFKGKFSIRETDFRDLLDSGKVQKARGYHKRNRTDYTQHKKREVVYKEPFESNQIKIHFEQFPLKDYERKVNEREFTSKEKAIIALDDYLKECYDTHELTPHEYVKVKRALNILKGEN